jgi:hypothetical protein
MTTKAFVFIGKDEGKIYHLNVFYHREDGPAVEYPNGAKYWYRHGKLHREDGPAAKYACGTKYWYLQDKQYTEEEYWRMIKLKTLW